MNLGAMSESLAVKDLAASRKFYEMLGFEVLAGGAENNYLTIKNDQHLIGRFRACLKRIC